MSDFRNRTRIRVLKELWQDYHSQEGWYQFDRWLDRQFKSNHAFGKRDRRWYSEYLFTAFRYAELAFAVLGDKLHKTSEKDVKARFLRWNTDAFWAIIEERAGFPEKAFADDLEKHKDRLLEFKSDALMWAGLPAHWAPSIQERAEASEWSEDQTQKFIEYIGIKAPLWIRLNQIEKLEELKKELAHENIRVLEEDAEALSVEGNKSLYALQSFINGAFEIQDWASQQIIKLVDFKGLKRVWDACAGAGGKSLQIAFLMRNKGLLYSSDLRAYKLEELRRRAKRDNVQNIRTFEWQGELPDWKKLPEVKDGFFDLVFVDAPCSSSGVIRRNPELRFKFSQEELPELNKLQLKILHNAATSVRPGGFLCYGTCSFFVQENERIVEQFSQKNSRFTLISQKMHGMPARNSDATFSALWQRQLD
ncbi:MAG: RsmB/NOP family class I SAM-dependent RNA methyltransferase [Bdellovibrionota bacterium]